MHTKGKGDETGLRGLTILSLHRLIQIVGDKEEVALRSSCCCSVQQTSTQSRNSRGYAVGLCTELEKEMRLV